MKNIKFILKLLLLASLFATSTRAANVIVYDSVVSLATNATKDYTFVDPATSQSVTIAVTLSAYSPTDPSATFSVVDGATHLGVDGNIINAGAGAKVSATLVSASGGVELSSVAFGITGVGIRPVDGGGTANWTSSASASAITFSNSTEYVQTLDTATASLNGANYSGQLVFPGNAYFQLSDASPFAGQSMILNATFTATGLLADPRTNCWFTTYAGKYARIYTNDMMLTNGTPLTTWSNGSETQANPAYCGIQEVYSSTNWIYVRSTGLASYNMGPWMNGNFPNLPVNQKLLYHFPRTNSVPTTKTANGGGQIGVFVDGVAMFNSWDAFTWDPSTSSDAQNYSGYWNRDAYVNEGVSFDPGNAHQQNTGVYHYHADPIALRYLLGDHVDYDSATKTYSESTNTPTQHSPILAWTADGIPLYGPYGYSNATNASSGIRRMVSGYVVRNGQYGTSNLTANGRTTIPDWAVRLYTNNPGSNQPGPNVSVSYPLGRYMEDNDYLGDLGYTQGVDFDLDQYNCRWCVTPEFPKGTYAYFCAISSNGTPVFPYNIGRGYFGSPTGGSISSISDTVATNFLGYTNLPTVLGVPAVKNGTVALSWSAIEGGSYQVAGASNLPNWTVIASGLSPNEIAGGYTNVSPASRQFYRVGRTSVSTYDSAGTTTFSGPSASSVAPGGSASGGQNVTLTITLPSSPPWPPANAPLGTVMLTNLVLHTGIISTNNTDAVQGTVLSTFALPSVVSPETNNVVISFSSGPTYTLSNGFIINP